MDEERVFTDADQQPTEASLSEALGVAREYYDRVLTLASDFTAKWVFSKGSGWILKVADKKKALCYVTPLRDKLIVGMAIREAERDELLGRQALASLHPAMREARKLPEGYALVFVVGGPDEWAPAELLVSEVMALRR